MTVLFDLRDVGRDRDKGGVSGIIVTSRVRDVTVSKEVKTGYWWQNQTAKTCAFTYYTIVYRPIDFS